MLTIGKAIKAGQGEYYLSLASTDDYYLSGHEPPGYWLGQGAAELSLAGELQPEHFRNLLRGLSADGERKLVRNADAERRAGWDLTWSAPKSVSVAWSQASPETRLAIEACLRRAVSAGIAYLEEVGAVTRRGLDGLVHEKARLLFGAFLHSTSRAQDPQLHVHTILLNVAIRRDGTTGTVEPKLLYRHQVVAGTLFRAELALALELDLGLRSRREGRSFELLGVDPALITFFSKRRAAIEAELARRGQSGAKAAEQANFATRQKKEIRPREELFAEWRQIGREHHWSTKELSWLLHAPFPPRNVAWEHSAAGEEAIKKITESESHFSSRQLLQSAAESCQGRGLGAADAQRIGRDLLRSPDVIELCVYRGERHYTTKATLELERSVVATAEAIFQRRQVLSDAAPVDAVLRSHPKLSSEQSNALRHLTAAKGGLVLLHGMAGTGKSTLFAAAKAVWEQQGLEVQGAAPSGRAAAGLADGTGISSTTLHRFLRRCQEAPESLTPKSVVVLDEAGMIGTRQLAQVLNHCARQGASLVLAGDARQLQPIEMGGLFPELCERLNASRLTEIRRQRDLWARSAVQDFAFGRAERALQAYHGRGLISENDATPAAVSQLMKDWKRHASSDLGNSIMLAGTTVHVDELNHRAQAERCLQQALGPIAIQNGPETFRIGDRVLFTRNAPSLRVCNGYLGTLTGAHGKAVTVQLDNGHSVQLDPQKYPHLRLGYAVTTHKSQGMTVERSFVLTGSTMTDRELSYVQASRARGDTRWYLTEELDAVSQRMTRSHEKVAALSLVDGPMLQQLLIR